MPQISLYIDEETLKKVEEEAKREHLSISKWVSDKIKERIEPKYPVGFENLFGSIDEENLIRPDQYSNHYDSNREVL